MSPPNTTTISLRLWLDLLLRQRSSNLSDSCFRSVFFLFPIEPTTPVPSRVTSQWRERPSSSNGDHYSSLLLVAGHVPHGRHLPTTCGRHCSSEHTSRLSFWSHQFPPAAPRHINFSAAELSEPNPPDLFAPRSASMLHLPASRCVTCTSPRAAGTSPKIVRQLVLLFVLRGLGDICTHQRQAYWHQHF